MFNKRSVENYLSSCESLCLEFSSEKEVDQYLKLVKSHNKNVKYASDPTQGMKKHKVLE
jgi:hypothetical protein